MRIKWDFFFVLPIFDGIVIDSIQYLNRVPASTTQNIGCPSIMTLGKTKNLMFYSLNLLHDSKYQIACQYWKLHLILTQYAQIHLFHVSSRVTPSKAFKMFPVFHWHFVNSQTLPSRNGGNGIVGEQTSGIPWYLGGWYRFIVYTIHSKMTLIRNFYFVWLRQGYVGFSCEKKWIICYNNLGM